MTSPDGATAAFAARRPTVRQGARPQFGAIDLGTNNCRLLVAEAAPGGFRVIDSFSRIVRLGEGLHHTGALSDAAMERTIHALRVCADKIAKRPGLKVRCIATQACRAASNGSAFLGRVERETGLAFDLITPKEEARLAVVGCASLIAPDARGALVVDIGGGSTELSWVRAVRHGPPQIEAWVSAPVGVVTLAERFPEHEDRQAWYAAMVDHALAVIDERVAVSPMRGTRPHPSAHIIGTSGTVTSLAGVHLNLPRYQRSQVDGLWMSRADAHAASRALQALSRAGRAAQPCIGPERADLVLAGCAIFDAILHRWPIERLRVADRGLREGVLLTMINRRRRRRRRAERAAFPS